MMIDTLDIDHFNHPNFVSMTVWNTNDDRYSDIDHFNNPNFVSITVWNTNDDRYSDIDHFNNPHFVSITVWNTNDVRYSDTDNFNRPHFVSMTVWNTNDDVTHKSTVACTVMCRQDGRGRFPVLLDNHSKCRTNSQRKSQLS